MRWFQLKKTDIYNHKNKMKRLLERMKGNATLIASIDGCTKQITPILQKFITNFPDYTDHSIDHSMGVLKYISFLIDSELEKLNEDEIYILILAGLLHDIGKISFPK
ncbi:MAG: HD domain protein, partial [Candidatus Falkowbacteria bacterium GW2011_GWF2_39_8]